MTTEELHQQLAGLRIPQEAFWWPLAPGWWLILLLTIALIIFLGFRIRHRKSIRLYRTSHNELVRLCGQFANSDQETELIQALSSWLKRVSIQYLSNRSISSLTEDEWLKFLDSIVDTTEFTEGAGDIFGSSVYSANPQYDSRAITSLCYRWLDCMEMKTKRSIAIAGSVSRQSS